MIAILQQNEGNWMLRAQRQGDQTGITEFTNVRLWRVIPFLDFMAGG
jgi:hypothetical protein